MQHWIFILLISIALVSPSPLSEPGSRRPRTKLGFPGQGTGDSNQPDPRVEIEIKKLEWEIQKWPHTHALDIKTLETFADVEMKKAVLVNDIELKRIEVEKKRVDLEFLKIVIEHPEVQFPPNSIGSRKVAPVTPK